MIEIRTPREILTFKGDEIPMRLFSHQPQMNMWVFHATFKKQIIYA